MKPWRLPKRNRFIQRHVAQLALAFLIPALNVAIVEKAPAAATRKVFVFQGKIQAVDTVARTFMLQAEKKTYVFSVTDETKIIHNGATQSFSDLKRGQVAEVDMKLGPDGKGVAVCVNLTSFGSMPVGDLSSRWFGLPNVMAQSLVGATTLSGKTLSAQQLKPLVLHAAWPPDSVGVRVSRRLKVGVFLLGVLSDGTVAKVEILQSTGHRGMDGDVVRAFMKWRFRPNSVSEVRVPAFYTRTF